MNNTFDSTVVSAADTVTASPASKKRGWLPLLTVLFLISYGLMTMLIIEQGQTIESQRALIRELFRDSTELSAVKQAQIARNAAAAETQSHSATPAAKASATQTPSTQIPSNQIPSTQVPSTQIPSKQVPSAQTPSTQIPSAPKMSAPTAQTPSSQAVPQHQSQKQYQKPQFQMPSRPASDLMDENRSLITI